MTTEVKRVMTKNYEDNRDESIASIHLFYMYIALKKCPDAHQFYKRALKKYCAQLSMVHFLSGKKTCA